MHLHALAPAALLLLAHASCGIQLGPSEQGSTLLAGAHRTPSPLSELPQPPARAIFFAGLEGTGHHVVSNFLNNLSFIPDRLGVPEGWKCGQIWHEDQIPIMAQTFRRYSDAGQVHVVEELNSYPNCGVENHTGRADGIYSPRLEFIARAAQLGGVQLHVLYLARHLEDALRANCLRRDFEECTREAATMRGNAALLARQVRAVQAMKNSSVHFHCFPYGRKPQMAEAIRRASGMDGSQAEALIDLAWDENHTKPNMDFENYHPPPPSLWTALVLQLSMAEIQMWGLCRELGL